MIMADSDDLRSIANEPSDVVRIERLTHHIERIRDDQHAMRAAIERMSEAVTRLTLVEGQSQGKRIVADENGYPILQEFSSVDN